jgi:hypothetical protein
VVKKIQFSFFSFFSFFILFLINIPSIYAQSLNWQSLLVGDEAAGMGGAYTSQFTDTAANGFYNPAGYAFLAHNSNSASVGVYKKFDLQYGTGSDILSASLRMNRGFFRAVPASTSSTFQFKELPFVDAQSLRLAFSILVPRHEEYSGDVLKTLHQTSRLNYKMESLWVGPSAAMRWGESKALGISLFYLAETSNLEKTFRSSALDQAQSYSRIPSCMRSGTQSRVDFGTHPVTYHGDQSRNLARVQSENHYRYEFESRVLKTNHVLMVLGYQEEILPRLRFGVTGYLVPFFVGSSGERESIHFDSSTNSLKEFSELSLVSKLNRPEQISLGLSYQYDDFIFSGDLKWFGSRNQFDLELAESSKVQPFDFSVRSIINYSLGFKWRIKDFLNLRVGLFTDKSPHFLRQRSSQRWQADFVDQYGFSSNIAYKDKSMEYTFGGYYVGGQGRAWVFNGTDFSSVTKAHHIFTMLVGVNYSTH